jgi:hypothetical protein
MSPEEKLQVNLIKMFVRADFIEKFGEGDTAEEILTLDKRAIEYYQDRWDENRSILDISIDKNIFKNKIQQKVAMIMHFVREYTNEIMEG